MKSKGIGYQEYRKRRMDVEGLRASDIEKAGNERYLIYFGRAHVVDHETNTEHRGPLKIGRGKFATALMRGRNQPGIDFRIYSEIILETNDATKDIEMLIKGLLLDKNITLSQNQQECYDIKDDELLDLLDDIVESIDTKSSHLILEHNIFM